MVLRNHKSIVFIPTVLMDWDCIQKLIMAYNSYVAHSWNTHFLAYGDSSGCGLSLASGLEFIIWVHYLEINETNIRVYSFPVQSGGDW